MKTPKKATEKEPKPIKSKTEVIPIFILTSYSQYLYIGYFR